MKQSLLLQDTPSTFCKVSLCKGNINVITQPSLTQDLPDIYTRTLGHRAYILGKPLAAVLKLIHIRMYIYTLEYLIVGSYCPARLYAKW